MQASNTYNIYFSPTGSTRKISTAIAQGICPGTAETPAGNDLSTTIDLTFLHAPTSQIPREAVAILAVPVYGGHIPPIVRERIGNVHGNGTPAVIVVVYGNRAFEKAAAELAALATRQGFIPVAAAAFVGEHSYSTSQSPIAAGRPDEQDLTRAREFGAAVQEKIARTGNSAPKPIHVKKLKDAPSPLLPRLRFLRFAVAHVWKHRHGDAFPLPAGNADLCTHCGRCVAVCPVHAIYRGNELHTDGDHCIRCCACVKQCPVGARTFHTPFSAALSQYFPDRKPAITLL